MGSRLSARHRTALVTGASSGLGEAFAEMLATEGVQVWVSARQPERLDSLRARYPGRIIPVVLDLADGPGAEAAFGRAAAQAGGMFDLLVNNAGYGLSATLPAWRARSGRNNSPRCWARRCG